jgi:Trk K+ transport system NAD-binding subunit
MIRIPTLEGTVGKKVMDLSLPAGIRINVIYRRKRPILVSGTTEIKKGDEILLIGKTKDVYKLADEIKQLSKVAATAE